MISSPSGSPAAVNPPHTTIDGTAATFVSSGREKPSSGRCSVSSGAVPAVGAVSSTSNFSNALAVAAISRCADAGRPCNPRHGLRHRNPTQRHRTGARPDRPASGRDDGRRAPHSVSSASLQEDMRPMPDPVDALLRDMLGWLAREPRPYGEVMEAWRTSCPRLPVWEEATDRGFVEQTRIDRGAVVSVTPTGQQFLAQH
jgi:hypothetical protein